MKRSAIVAVGLSLAVLAGCGQTTEPSPPPTSEDALTTTDESEVTSEAPTTEPAVTEEPEADGPPEMPEEATEQTEAGAEAFVQYYVDAFNYAYVTNSTETVMSLAAETCKSCSGILGLIPDAAPKDFRYLTITDSVSSVTADSAVVQADMEQADPAGGDSSTGTAVYELAWSDGWQVSEIKLQAEQ